MKRKTAIVTGGTSGVGYSIVRALAKHNYKIYFIGTQSSKGLEIEKEISADPGPARAKFVRLDLGNLKEVQEWVKEFRETHTKLDLLANIAGLLLPEKKLTADNLEKTFVVSYLSAFYLTNQLLPLMEHSDQARIVNVAAKASLLKKPVVDLNTLKTGINYNGIKASTMAVHAKTVFTQCLAARINPKNITVNSFNPGYIKSSLSRNLKGLPGGMMRMASAFFSKESITGINLCLSDEFNHTTGKLLDGKKTITLNFPKDYCDKLWEDSENIILASLS